MSRSFALGATFETFIDGEVGSGRYDDANEVVREGLRLLKELSSPLHETEELRHLVLEARRDPELVDADEVFERLAAKYAAPPEAAGR